MSEGLPAPTWDEQKADALGKQIQRVENNIECMRKEILAPFAWMGTNWNHLTYSFYEALYHYYDLRIQRYRHKKEDIR
jgi:hypothetical protein